MKCEKCNSEMIGDKDRMYASFPPKYGYECPKCGHYQYSSCAEWLDDTMKQSENFV